MRTAEEIKEWVFDQRHRNKDGRLHQIEAETLDGVLAFINSEPPCQHIYGVDEHNTDTGEIYYRNFKFCPDCGEKLQ